MAAVEDMESLYESCGQAKVGRLAEAEFDFMKKELTADDESNCVPPAVTNYDVFPTDDPGLPAPTPAPPSAPAPAPLSSAGGADTSPSETSLGAFLRRQGLSIYRDKLADLGWDDLSVLEAMSGSELNRIARKADMKPGHAAKFVEKISIESLEAMFAYM